MARGFPGRIIAARTADGVECSGKNIFDLLKIPKTEYDFLNDELCEGGVSTVAMYSGFAPDRAVIAFRFFAYDSSLVLAVVPDCSPDIVASLAERGELPDTVIAPRLRELAKGRGTKDSQNENAICEYMARIYGCADILAGLCRPNFRPDADDVRFAANAVGMLIGLGVDTEVTFLPERYSMNGTRIFAGELCVSAMLTFAMIARKYSRRRAMLFELISDGEDVFLKFSFDTYGAEDHREELERLSMIVKGHRELYFDFGEEEGILWLETWPFYYDVGVAEVKRPDPFVKLRIPRELFGKTQATRNTEDNKRQ
jgi:hypothetical protein